MDLAGEDSSQIIGCKLILTDIIDFMNSDLNFYELVKMNQLRYIYWNANLLPKTFDRVMGHLSNISSEYIEIDNDFEDHKFLLIHQINEYV